VIVSVVSGGKTIFCEGKQTSLDYQLLSRLVEGMPGDKCTIVPAGSKFTFSIFAQGYFFPDEVENQRFIIFRDRDFDVKPAPNIQLLQIERKLGNNAVILTYRACVENYLLDTNLIHNYWVAKHIEKLANPTSKWAHGDSPGIETIAAWVETSARNLQSYQAARWALGDLLSMSAARVQLKTTWTGGSGKLPASLILSDCRSKALELINQFTQAVESVTPENFEARLDAYQQHFIQEDFWVQKQYLIWFHGKDLQKEMQRQEPKYISLSSFFDWATAQVDVNQHPDLMELRTRIEQL
jgi:hypothetical protein